MSSFCSISVICYKSGDARFGLSPRQKEHTDDQLGHIYSIRLNQIMVTSLFSFPVINCTIKSRYTPILYSSDHNIITNIICIKTCIKQILEMTDKTIIVIVCFTLSEQFVSHIMTRPSYILNMMIVMSALLVLINNVCLAEKYKKQLHSL